MSAQEALPMPLGGEPEPMIPRLAEILTWWQASRPRSLQTKLGPSEIGDPCGRRLALRIVNPQQKSGLKWAALLGVWGHGGIETALMAYNAEMGQERYLIEHRVSADETVSSGVGGQEGVDGSTDVFDTWTGEVVDWKFTGKHTADDVRRTGDPGPAYRVQVHTYGLGWQRKGFDVRSVRIVFLPRGSNNIRDGIEWSEPFDERIALDAIARVEKLAAQAGEAEAGQRDWASIEAYPVGWKCANFCPYFQPEVAPDRNGCPGHTKVYVPVETRLAACRSSGDIRGLWYELKTTGELDSHRTRTLINRIGKEVKAAEQAGATPEEIAAIVALSAGGFHNGAT